MRAREAVRAAELAQHGHLLRLWRPPLAPGEWRTYGLFSAADADGLEKLLASMPLRAWRTDDVTQLLEHANDPFGRPGTTAAAPGNEFFTWFTIVIPADAGADEVASAATEARRTTELAREGRLLRLWMLPDEGTALGVWAADDIANMRADLDSLPMINWLDVEVTPLSVHPSDPANGTVR